MRLFHGSLNRVEDPCIMPREFYRPLDFGVGFYTTTDVEQALRWVQLRLFRNPSATSGCVMEYDFDELLLDSDEFKVKKFDGVSSQWLSFIAANRLHGNIDHGYDIVMGPVADDRVYTVLNLYEGGFIDEVEAMKRMKAYRLADQVLFHTQRALRGLRYVTTREVPR